MERLDKQALPPPAASACSCCRSHFLEPASKMDNEGLPRDVAALIREMDNFLRAIADEKMDVKTKALKISLQKSVRLCRDQYRLDLTHRDEEDEEEDEDMYDDACGTTWAHDLAPSPPLTWKNKSVAPAVGAPSHENTIKEGYLEVKKRDAGRVVVDQALNAFCVLTARELRLYGDKKDKKLRCSVSLACCQVKQREDCHQERCCFQLVARDKTSHEFTAASVKEADSWVEAIQKMTGDWDVYYRDVYQGLWDCKADAADELSFRRGDLVHIVSKDYEKWQWWVGELDGKVGLVPRAFLAAAYEM
ncbi:LOW QUALITY PROTEIN: src kinase-associated phosphoprotein 2-B-like [Lethenteron reissneri]|uniref:LOW QUALITY PROTEIN: src kinase-associated phosphoprotein 2-B-like n=1 Tax=Lethenteron reissneri TaxID=7753 RepID=UPI002AB7853A|nr:LOW QUALITY PROTEIN: src kinase-associated phosphoprotein 2-B-like [Lethenteron reissneri]